MVGWLANSNRHHLHVGALLLHPAFASSLCLVSTPWVPNSDASWTAMCYWCFLGCRRCSCIKHFDLKFLVICFLVVNGTPRTSKCWSTIPSFDHFISVVNDFLGCRRSSFLSGDWFLVVIDGWRWSVGKLSDGQCQDSNGWCWQMMVQLLSHRGLVQSKLVHEAQFMATKTHERPNNQPEPMPLLKVKKACQLMTFLSRLLPGIAHPGNPKRWVN